MSKLRVQSFSVSIDGYGAGPNQSLDNPLERARQAAAALGYQCAEHVATPNATHLVLTKR